MKSRKVVLYFAITGAGFPLVWLALYFLFGRDTYSPPFMGWMYEAWTVPFVQMFWPSSILLLAESWELNVVAVTCNVVLYTVVGWLIWFGLNRHRAILVVVGGAILVAWVVVWGEYLWGNWQARRGYPD